MTPVHPYRVDLAGDAALDYASYPDLQGNAWS